MTGLLEATVDVVSTAGLIRTFRPRFTRMLAEEFAPWRTAWRRTHPLMNGQRITTRPAGSASRGPGALNT